MLENDDSPEAVGKRLRYLRQLANLKREELAEKADVNPSSISLWENARSKNLQQKSIKKLLSAIQEAGINCNQMWLLQGIGPEPAQRKQFITESSKSSDAITLTQNEATQQTEREIQLFQSLHSNAVVLKINHTGMVPFYEPGDIVGGLWIPSSAFVKERNCIVKIRDELDVRRVTLNNDHTLNLTYTSMNFAEGQIPQILSIKLNMVAPVVRVWHQLANRH